MLAYLNGGMVVFYLLSVCILACAVLLINLRKVIYMALALGGIFLGCAAVYFLVGAEFVGVAQLLVYAGAITILIMFAIMLTNHEAMEPALRWTWRQVAAAAAAVLLCAVLLWTIRSTVWPPSPADVDLNQGNSNPVAVGIMLFRDYAVPFELVSLLLIVGLVGAVILARERKEEDE
ncbi:MAG: NADH-quinone oxidoreductase subunit J [Alicyclobacillus sp.]|nr:NADH-quinone oxidoreductase subunit J [Alicyclobacillus sp.]